MQQWLTPEAYAMIAGTPWGPKPPPSVPLPDKDPRTYALERLREYIAALVFARTGSPTGPVEDFRIPFENVLVEMPDDVKDLKFPSVVFNPARGTHEAPFLGAPDLIDNTIDVFGKNTALLEFGEYIELFSIEVWGSKRAERRALLAGLKIALRPIEEANELRLTLPAYFNKVAQFTMLESQYIDEPDVIRGRRRGMIFLELRVDEVKLVDTRTMLPILSLGMLEAHQELSCSTNPFVV